MADGFEDILQNILNDPSAMEKVSGIISALKSDDTTKEDNPPKEEGSAFPGFDNPEMLMKLAKMYSKISSDKDDPRVNLLTALKPYMGDKRKSNMDQAIKILQLTKISSLMSENNLF